MNRRQGGGPRSFIVRILRYDHDDWQGQLVDVRSGTIYAFASFLQLQRLMLSLADSSAVMPAPGTAAQCAFAWATGRETQS